MHGIRESLLTLALVGLVFTGPAALAAWVLIRPASPTIQAAVTATAEIPPAAPGAGVTPAPVVSGVLHTRGAATVDWNGIRIPVEDASYAYLGGEVVETADDAIAMLELAGGNRVYVCPGSRVSLERGDTGAYMLSVRRGISRYVFEAGTDFQVHANQGLVTPGKNAGGGPVVGEIAVFEDHPGGVVCGFDNTVDVAGFAQGPGRRPVALGSAGPGEIVDLSRALREERAITGTPVVLQPIAMPAEVMGWLNRNAGPSRSGTFTGYLCRCEELKRYADADGIPDTAIAPRLEPPETGELALSDPAPALEPPDSPPVALAVPETPDAAEPGVLPAPPAAPEGPGLTVPPPAVPVGGSGGGVTSTAS